MELKIDLHVHSDASIDGRSTLDELAGAAKARGLDALMICDHNKFTLTAPEVREGVLLMPGCEVSTASGHLLALFCREPFEIPPELPTLAEAASLIHAHGGLAVIAHPFTRADRDREAEAAYLDGAECANARAYFHNPDANKMAADFAARHDLLTTGGSDAHHMGEVGNCYTLLTCDGRSPEAIEAAVRAGKCRPVFQKNTSRTRKGLSQFKAARRRGGLKNLCVGAAYVAYCAGRDILHI